MIQDWFEAVNTAYLPFVCSSCDLLYGDGSHGPSLISFTGDATNIVVGENHMQCPRCHTMNRQALPDGAYNITNGKWHLLYRVAREVLAADASEQQYRELVRLIELAQASHEKPSDIAVSIESISPFGQIARLIRQNPDRALAILGMLISVLAYILPPSSSWEAKPAPAPVIKLAELSPAAREKLAQEIANDLASKFPPDSVTRAASQPLPGRNQPCHCGSGIKFKKCCGDTRKR